MNTYWAHTGGAWNAWSPSVSQAGIAVTATASNAGYFRAGRLITFNMVVTMTATSAGSGDVSVSLPVAAATANAVLLGIGMINDVSASTFSLGFATPNGTTLMRFRSVSGNLYLGNAGFTVALATGDVISASGSYEAAS